MQSGDRDAAARLETFAVGMRMGVEEPRHDRTTVEVDELGGGSGLFEERRVVADGRDVARSHRDRLRQSRAAIECDDLAAVQNQIRRKHASVS